MRWLMHHKVKAYLIALPPMVSNVFLWKMVMTCKSLLMPWQKHEGIPINRLLSKLRLQLLRGFQRLPVLLVVTVRAVQNLRNLPVRDLVFRRKLSMFLMKFVLSLTSGSLNRSKIVSNGMPHFLHGNPQIQKKQPCFKAGCVVRCLPIL